MDKVLMQMEVRSSVTMDELATLTDPNDALDSLSFYMRHGSEGDWQLLPIPPAMLRPFMGMALMMGMQSPEAFQPIRVPDSLEG